MKCPRPECGGELRPHCPNTGTTLVNGKIKQHTCPWQTCTRCKARLDLNHGRGFTRPVAGVGSMPITFTT